MDEWMDEYRKLKSRQCPTADKPNINEKELKQIVGLARPTASFSPQVWLLVTLNVC